jgi:hypothetical protein
MSTISVVYPVDKVKHLLIKLLSICANPPTVDTDYVRVRSKSEPIAPHNINSLADLPRIMVSFPHMMIYLFSLRN